MKGGVPRKALKAEMEFYPLFLLLSLLWSQLVGDPILFSCYPIAIPASLIYFSIAVLPLERCERLEILNARCISGEVCSTVGLSPI